MSFHKLVSEILILSVLVFFLSGCTGGGGGAGSADGLFTTDYSLGPEMTAFLSFSPADQPAGFETAGQDKETPAAPVPEPASIILLGLGVFSFALILLRKDKAVY